MGRKLFAVLIGMNLVMGCSHLESPPDEEESTTIIEETAEPETAEVKEVPPIEGPTEEAEEPSPAVSEEPAPAPVEEPTPPPQVAQDPTLSPPIVTPEPAPSPKAARPGRFARLERDCEVHEEPAANSQVLRTLHAGRRLWTEIVDSQWKRVFAHGTENYMPAECFQPPAPAVQGRAEEPLPPPEPPTPVAEPSPDVPAAPPTQIPVAQPPVLPQPAPSKVEVSRPPVGLAADSEPSGTGPEFAVGLAVGFSIVALVYLVRTRNRRKSLDTLTASI